MSKRGSDGTMPSPSKRPNQIVFDRQTAPFPLPHDTSKTVSTPLPAKPATRQPISTARASPSFIDLTADSPPPTGKATPPSTSTACVEPTTQPISMARLEPNAGSRASPHDESLPAKPATRQPIFTAPADASFVDLTADSPPPAGKATPRSMSTTCIEPKTQAISTARLEPNAGSTALPHDTSSQNMTPFLKPPRSKARPSTVLSTTSSLSSTMTSLPVSEPEPVWSLPRSGGSNIARTLIDKSNAEKSRQLKKDDLLLQDMSSDFMSVSWCVLASAHIDDLDLGTASIEHNEDLLKHGPHLPSGAYQCDSCNATFQTRRMVMNHAQCHESAYEAGSAACPAMLEGYLRCPLEFANAETARRHLTDHRTELYNLSKSTDGSIVGIYTCEVGSCQIGFINLKDELSHAHTSHPQPMRPDDVCPCEGQYGIRCHFISPTAPILYKHMTESHGPWFYALGINHCPHGPVCGMGFLRKEMLYYHLYAKNAFCRGLVALSLQEDGKIGNPNAAPYLRHTPDHFRPGYVTEYNYDARPVMLCIFSLGSGKGQRRSRIASDGARFMEKEALRGGLFVRARLGLGTTVRLATVVGDNVSTRVLPAYANDRDATPSAIYMTKRVLKVFDAAKDDDLRILVAVGLDAFASDVERLHDYCQRTEPFIYVVIVAKNEELLERHQHDENVYYDPTDIVGFIKFHSWDIIQYVENPEQNVNPLWQSYSQRLAHIHQGKMVGRASDKRVKLTGRRVGNDSHRMRGIRIVRSSI